MSERRKSSVLAGPALVVVATLCLWYNEGRFDYYKAALQAAETNSPKEAGPQQTVAVSGFLEKPTIDGHYTTGFSGYYQVFGDAEIYSWHRRKDDDGDVRWSKGWHSRLQNNDRNRGLRKVLKDVRRKAKVYRLNGLEIVPAKLHFVDSFVSIPTPQLTLSDAGTSLGLQLGLELDGFYLSKGARGEKNLGDERIRYRGIPAATTASYFGRIENERGVAKQFEFKRSYVSGLIRDDGILHHLVNGNRSDALATIKSHLRKLKWIIRLAGTAGIVVGFLFFFSRFLHLLIAIPLIGRLVEAGVFIVSLVLGLSVAILTILTGMLFHHAWVGLAGLAVVAAVVVFALLQSRKTKANAQRTLHDDAGLLQAEPPALPSESLSQSANFAQAAGDGAGAEPAPMADIAAVPPPLSSAGRARKTFCNMVRVALADETFDDKENDFLVDWARAKGLSDEEIVELFEEAKKEKNNPLETTGPDDLYFLASLAMADGYMSPKELHHLLDFGEKLGMSKARVRAMISSAMKGEAPTHAGQAVA